ncbi:MAG: adenylyltransferase/cytidyltransferase family protein [Candidatus Sungbacteria bacterium]|uniref:Adenylyltransferase/cytidyltransferase family protein n=1 Tax=Candidatus Sungiibacteriota bacterium TaxID=2750080 RepID=A0A933DUD1_9BACT|nr:adenylyltransferase/cytidyltransferase family protein [Candidatus Sungbacteria bacterium]
MLSPETYSKKIVTDYGLLREKADAHRILGHRIIATLGSWDMLHIGHLRYLHRAKSHGDILIVGVDSDRGIKSYKNPLRPIIPESERMETLSYQAPVDYVTLVDDISDTGQWACGLLKSVPIDAFVAEATSYPEEQLKEIAAHCPEVIVLPRQAIGTSSSDIIQNIVKGHLLEMLDRMRKK